MGRILLSVCIVLILFQNIAFAVPSEGNWLPHLHSSIWGVQFNHVFKRDFNKIEGKARTTQYFIRASFALTERFFLDTKVGLGSVSFDRNDGLNLDFSTGFAGGYGLRYLLYEDTGIKSIFGFQHVSCHPLKDNVGNAKHKIIWDEWQGTWLLIKEDWKTAIYCGPQYSTVQLKYKVDNVRRRLKAEDSWGFLIGSNYRFTKKASLNAELRFFDEWAFNLGFNYKF